MKIIQESVYIFLYMPTNLARVYEHINQYEPFSRHQDACILSKRTLTFTVQIRREKTSYLAQNREGKQIYWIDLLQETWNNSDLIHVKPLLILCLN